MTLQSTIEQAFTKRQDLSPSNCPPEIKQVIDEVFQQINTGQLRVANKQDGQWKVNQWVKQAVLLSFKIRDNQLIDHSPIRYYDKVAQRYENYSDEDFALDQIRAVPGSIVRTGTYIGKNVILMPCFVNIGAYVGSGSMIDTWATVGSCAQIGENVHISGGAGIGGVFEPLQASPTIIEDNVFIGARSEIVEGVIVEKNAVISMGVFIGQSTKIYNRQTGEISYGKIPEGAVVVPGSLPSEDGKYSLNCAVIIKQVDEKTRAKTSLNDLLR